MRIAKVFVHGIRAGELIEIEMEKNYEFIYAEGYSGEPVSLTMPIAQKIYIFTNFPPFFDGVLPEGIQLEAMLRISKIDKNDLFSQLLLVGADLVGSVTVEEKQ